MAGTVEVGRPEYTGANRCWPCTAVNLALLGTVCVLVGSRWPTVGAAFGLLGLGVIWHHGYLVPYTPTFAPRLVAWLPVDVFHRRPVPGSLETLGTRDADADGERILETLVEADVIEVGASGLTLTDTFRTEWDDAVAELSDRPPSELADAALDASPAATVAEANDESDETYVVLSDESGNVAWIRRPVAVAETAAARVLESHGVEPGRRDVAARSVCAFIEDCPGCGGAVVETSASSCCGEASLSPTVAAPRVLACEVCDVRFFTLESD